MFTCIPNDSIPTTHNFCTGSSSRSRPSIIEIDKHIVSSWHKRGYIILKNHTRFEYAFIYFYICVRTHFFFSIVVV